MQLYFHCGPLKNSDPTNTNIKQQETYEGLKIEVDNVSDIDVILNTTTTDNNNNDDNTPTNTVTTTATTNNSNSYNNNDAIIVRIIITIKMKSSCALKKLKVAIYIVLLISYSVKKMLLNSVLISVKVTCCF